MDIIHRLGEIEHRNDSVVTVGSFDGVHRGHRVVLDTTVERAHAIGGRSVAVTFDPHPREVLVKRHKNFHFLTSLVERRRMIEERGIEILYIIEFTQNFSRLSAQEFYETYVVRDIGVTEVVEGYSHYFGMDRAAGLEQLTFFGARFGFKLNVVEGIAFEGSIVSSSAIRECIERGRIAETNRLLGWNYSLGGPVVHGEHLGRTLGYPTANMIVEPERKLIPCDGVYVTSVKVSDHPQIFYGLTSIGVRPTVSQSGIRTVETYIYDFDEEIYGSQITITFLEYLRGQMKFSGVKELIAQMDRDRDCGIEIRNKLTQETKRKN
jgi:riboflavin kinase/FMN adenylyltransferase